MIDVTLGDEGDRRGGLLDSFVESVGSKIFASGYSREDLSGGAVTLRGKGVDGGQVLVVDSTSVKAVMSGLIRVYRVGMSPDRIVLTPAGGALNGGDLEVISGWLAAIVKPVQLLRPLGSELVQLGTRQASVSDRSTALAADAVSVAYMEDLAVGFDLDLVYLADAVAVEYRGLEVARVGLGKPVPTLAIGAGAADREMWEMLAPDLVESPREALATMVDIAKRYRSPGGAMHPLKLFRRPQWIRSELLSRGAEPLSVTYASGEVESDKRCFARSGDRLLTFVVGVDPSVVFESNAVAKRLGLSKVRLVGAERDLHPVLGEMAQRLGIDLEQRPVAVPWGI